MEEYTIEQSEDEMKSKTQNKYEFRWEDLEYWANKKPASEHRTEFSLEDLQIWSNIGKSQDRESTGIITSENEDKRKCKLFSYTCIRRIAMTKHVIQSINIDIENQ